MPKPQKGTVFLSAAFTCLCFSPLTTAAQASQWTGPDASDNIYNNNTGNVGIGMTISKTNLEVNGFVSAKEGHEDFKSRA